MQREKKERCVVYIVARTDNGERQLAREKKAKERKRSTSNASNTSPAT